METIDLRGLKCPLPALFAKRVLTNGADGLEIVVLTDDPMAPIDVPHMCRREGFAIIAVAHEGDTAHMILKRPIAWVPATDPDAPEHLAP